VAADAAHLDEEVTAELRLVGRGGGIGLGLAEGDEVRGHVGGVLRGDARSFGMVASGRIVRGSRIQEAIQSGLSRAPASASDGASRSSSGMPLTAPVWHLRQRRPAISSRPSRTRRWARTGAALAL
jgi:hypothetical protein